MAFPTKWAELHIRLSGAVRDRVTLASDDGNDLSSADRNDYLNWAWAKYVSLLVNKYRNNPEFMQSALSQMVKRGDATIASGVSTSVPTDFSVLLKLSKSGINVHKETHEGFVDILNLNIPHKLPSSTDQYVLQEGLTLSLLPASSAGTYVVVYVIKPTQITYTDGATDIPLDQLHFDSIIAFALSYIYSDKQEFDLSQRFEAEAYRIAPYQLKIDG